MRAASGNLGTGLFDARKPLGSDILAELVARLSGMYGRCMVVPEENRGELLIGACATRAFRYISRNHRKTR